MGIGYSGSPNRGYDTGELLSSISKLLDSPAGQGVALVGVGNLGRAIIAHVARQRPHLFVAAAFDLDPEKVGRVIHGCRTYALEELPRVTAELDLQVGIVAVPAAAAQAAADRLVAAGVHGLLNFAPLPLRVPDHVYLENLDWTVSLEKAAFFARHGRARAARSAS
jgi:redox-sensing transcriptional repressor